MNRQVGIKYDPEYIKGLCVKNRTTMEEMSRSLGMSQNYLAACAHRRLIPEDKLDKIIYVLDGDMDSAKGIFKRSDGTLAEEVPVEVPAHTLDVFKELEKDYIDGGTDEMEEVREHKKWEPKVQEVKVDEDSVLRDLRKWVAKRWVYGNKTISVTELMEYLDSINTPIG